MIYFLIYIFTKFIMHNLDHRYLSHWIDGLIDRLVQIFMFFLIFPSGEFVLSLTKSMFSRYVWGYRTFQIVKITNFN